MDSTKKLDNEWTEKMGENFVANLPKEQEQASKWIFIYI